MKKVKTFAVVLIAGVVGTSIFAFAESIHSHDYYYSKNAWVHSYLDLMNGGMFPDKVYANVSLQGVEGKYYKAKYWLRTNKGTVVDSFVDYYDPSDDYTGKIVGYVKWAKLYVDKEIDDKYDGYLYDNCSTATFYSYK